MNTSKVFMIREGKYVMTVYNKNKVPHVIGFRNYKDAEKALFQTDTRTVSIHEKIYGHQLEIIKTPCVQFGKLHIDTVNTMTFLDYANKPQQPKIALVENLLSNTKEHLLFDFVIVSDN
jgi:hypothetical protein